MLEFETKPIHDNQEFGIEHCIGQTLLAKQCVSEYDTWTVVADDENEYLKIELRVNITGTVLTAVQFFKRENFENFHLALDPPTIPTIDCTFTCPDCRCIWSYDFVGNARCACNDASA